MKLEKVALDESDSPVLYVEGADLMKDVYKRQGHESNHAHGTGTAQDHHHHEHRGIQEITYNVEDVYKRQCPHQVLWQLMICRNSSKI